MVRLEQFEPEDFQQLIDWIDSEAVMTSWSGNLFRYPLTERSLKWYIKDTNVFKKSAAYVYKVTDEDNNAIGHISLGSISWTNRSARVTRVLLGNNGQRGKGCCRQMVEAVLKIAFEDLNMHRVSLGVYSENIAAIKCYEKSGFIVEGIHRDVLRYKERWWSMIEMAVLRPDWAGPQNNSDVV